MSVLRVVSEKSGNQLGTITRADGGSIATSGLGQDIFDQLKSGKGWDDQQTFDALVDGGWSNGYVSVRVVDPEPAEL